MLLTPDPPARSPVCRKARRAPLPAFLEHTKLCSECRQWMTGLLDEADTIFYFHRHRN
jgi:hypothetical protein